MKRSIKKSNIKDLTPAIFQCQKLSILTRFLKNFRGIILVQSINYNVPIL